MPPIDYLLTGIAISNCVFVGIIGILTIFMSNGVRQGGILPPLLFHFYTRDLIWAVVYSNTGCCFSSCFINIKTLLHMQMT